ncbi:MAG: hypothetical protein GXP16_17720 [Gammaproteobacteria bacterium]|nr:hypothetical protein [Gammaproteobacteria bacterium]
MINNALESARATAVIDIGKSRCKVFILDESGCIIFEQSTATVSNGHLLNVAAIWQWLVKALGEASSQFNITAIFPVAHGATAALGSVAKASWYVLDYESDFSSVDAQYQARRGAFSETHSPNLQRGLNLARQLFWLKEKEPHIWAQAEQILLYPQYWAWRLCGITATEVTSLGCHTDLWNPLQGKFSQLAKYLAVDRKLPEFRHAWQVLGNIKGDIADATGLAETCQVYCGCHDSNASYAAYLARHEKVFSVVSTGTWMVCMSNGSQPVLDSTQDTLSNVDVMGRSVPCARFMGGREYDLICGSPECGSNITDALALITDGTFAQPAFTTLGGPFSARSGVLPKAVRKQQLPTLASLYCALMTDYCLDLAAARGTVFVEGRFCKDEVYMRALAGLRQAGVCRGRANGSCSGAHALMRWPEPMPMGEEEPISQPLSGMDEYRRLWRGALAL